MAQDIGIDRATSGPAATLLTATVTDTSTSPASAAVDFGTPTPIKAGYEVKLDCQASSNGLAYLYVVWSHDNSDFSDASNKVRVTIIDCTASTISIKCGEMEILARYAKFYLENQSGGSISNTSTTLTFWDVFGDVA